ncbi:winged helix-turn-helix domain-containing protein [Phenylobacterium sp. LH3H17]|uniref:winged helix-turn-helix domain-containing protein n=1 Tax=Phenylobacterium sp. LH3H17 TaxID=2903901 RepID=UPI0020C9D3B3|nr:winged helix-turn-helix domain-containing protein [Phenylobacterium sp. LH3H17]UTP38184.1 winged helix-turn-helix domain-containing protein [Phenylobacterium sp. LH3H17]
MRPATREVICDTATDVLEPRVMQVLAALAQRRGSVVSRGDLVTECWGGRAVGDDAINRCIQSLRRLSQARGGFSIRTVKGLGYRLDETPRASPPSEAVTLAVLAFDNLSGDPTLGWFSDGLSVEILQTVAAGAGVKVMGQGSSFQFRGAAKAAGHVGAELGVTHVLDGAVRRAGERLRINAHLVETAHSVTLWSQTFERDLTDVLAIQDDIARAVAAALSLTFAPSRRAKPLDPATYDLYLQARSPLSGIGGAADAMEHARAMQLLEQVTAHAPDFARAWAELAMRRVVCLRRFERSTFPGLTPAGAAEAANTALRLDPTLGLAHQAISYLGPLASYSARETLHRRALSAAPNDPEVLNHAGQFCAEVGRLGEALEHARQALTLDPLYWPAAQWYAGMLDALGRHDETPALWDAYTARWPDVEPLAGEAIAAAANAGDWDRLERLDETSRLRGLDSPSFRAFVDGQRNRRIRDPRFLQTHREIVAARLAQDGRLSLADIVRLHDLGAPEEAFEAAARASFAHLFDADGQVVGRWTPAILFLAANRLMIADRRFVSLCASVGLASYWASTGRWPDCADDPELPYDFRAECRLVLGAGGR